MRQLKRFFTTLTSLLLLSLSLASVAASGECGAIVQQALAMVEDTCAATGRNQACHGYMHVDAQPREPSDSFRFELGDIADLAGIQSLRTQPLNLDTGEWGVAFLRVQANLPDALPGRNATFLLFGDAEVSDTGDAVSNRPMQAIRLRTGIMGVTCEDAPLDGLLIQTPEDAERVTLNINDVPVSLGSTVFFQAETEESLTVTTLEGSARVTVHGVEFAVMPGETLRVPTGDSNVVESISFDAVGMELLPLELLDEQIIVPTTESQTDQIGGPTLPLVAPTQVSGSSGGVVDWCQPGNPTGGTPPWAGQPGGRAAWEAENCPNSPGTGNGNSAGGRGGSGGQGNGGGNNGNGGGGGGNGGDNGNGNGGNNGNGNGGGNGDGNGNGNGGNNGNGNGNGNNGGGNGNGNNGNGKVAPNGATGVAWTASAIAL